MNHLGSDTCPWSEYWTCLCFRSPLCTKEVFYFLCAYKVVFVRYLGGTIFCDLSVCLYSNHLNTGLQSPVFKWLGCVITILMLHNCPSYLYSGPDFKWFNRLNIRHKKVRYSDESGFHVSGIQMVTVVKIYYYFCRLPSKLCAERWSCTVTRPGSPWPATPQRRSLSPFSRDVLCLDIPGL